MRQVIDFNRKWGFSKEASAVPDKIPDTWYWVNIPHCWNAIDGQDGGNDYYRGTCYYAKEFELSELPAADRYFLEFQGTNSSAEVYVNGRKLGNHDGGYSTWRVDMTAALEAKNLIVVAVDNSENDRVYPQMADFTFYGGMYRNVRVIAVSESHFSLDYYGGPGIRVTPHLAQNRARVEVEVFLSHVKEDQKLEIVIKDAGGKTAAKTVVPANETIVSLTIDDVIRWNGRKNPYLYTAEAKLMEAEEVLDNVSVRFGCRSFEIDPQRGFILNGEAYPLRGVARHQDRLDYGNALLPEHHEEDMDLICELGATTIRLAHYQHDQYFYDLCDERGLIVWAEIPYISRHMPSGRENTISQMKELIIQNYHHPSIVVWGLSNEITINGSDEDLLENHRILNALCHELDPTRKTAIACVSMCDQTDPYIGIPDVVSYNHYFGWYGGDTSMNGPWFDQFHKAFPDIPIGMSEYGCEALNWHTSEPKQGDYTEEYQAHYHEELIKQLFSRDYLWATHVWNMFDFGADARNEGGENGQNHKGLVTFDRKYKKDAFYAYKAWLSDEPFVHICGKRYVKRAEDMTRITVYSNQPEVELFADGKSLGKKKAEDHFFRFDVPNRGTTVLRAVAGDCEDESVIQKVETFYEPYRLKEKGAVINWFDITEVPGHYSIRDTIGEIMESPEGAELFAALMRQLTTTEDGKESGIMGFEMSDGMMEMMKGFTIVRLVSMIGVMGKNGAPRVTKEMLLKLNAQLNQIKKPQRTIGG